MELTTPLGVSTIEVAADVRQRLAEVLAETFPAAGRVGLVRDANVAAEWNDPALPDGLEVVALDVPGGEASKTRAELGRLQDGLLALRRDEPVVAIGGGATTDVAGFAAATVRRGLPWVALPTSVIGMADAAVGGKVGINHDRGKNLLGAFHPARHVLADVAYLASLPARETVSGLAELYKCARIGDPFLRRRLAEGAPHTPADWAVAVRSAVAVKARLVEADLHDRGPRRLLNYGHTVGHALERELGPARMRHGEAVAVGMQAAMALAHARGLVPAAEVTAQRAELTALGLDVAFPDGASLAALVAAMHEDKKRTRDGALTFVLPTGTEGAAVFDDVTPLEVAAALETLA